MQYTKITISKRRVVVAYSRSNNTILSLSDLSSPESTNYGPTDFFPIYDMAMANDTDSTTGLDYLYWIAQQVLNDYPYDLRLLLMQLISVPVGIFNDASYWGLYPQENQNVRAFLASPSYRVTNFVYGS
jgi:hypothetical protein